MDDLDCWIPTVVVLLDRVRRVSADEACSVVRAELGAEAADTVQLFGAESQGMRYIQWRYCDATYHLGTSSEPYISVIGVSKLDTNMRKVVQTKWTMREELPPEGEAHGDAWMSHNAFLYVDAILWNTQPQDRARLRQSVFRIASQFVDERCVLLWFCGSEPKRVALPTAQAIGALRAGEWPS